MLENGDGEGVLEVLRLPFLLARFSAACSSTHDILERSLEVGDGHAAGGGGTGGRHEERAEPAIPPAAKSGENIPWFKRQESGMLGSYSAFDDGGLSGERPLEGVGAGDGGVGGQHGQDIVAAGIDQTSLVGADHARDGMKRKVGKRLAELQVVGRIEQRGVSRKTRSRGLTLEVGKRAPSRAMGSR